MVWAIIPVSGRRRHGDGEVAKAPSKKRFAGMRSQSVFRFGDLLSFRLLSSPKRNRRVGGRQAKRQRTFAIQHECFVPLWFLQPRIFVPLGWVGETLTDSAHSRFEDDELNPPLKFGDRLFVSNVFKYDARCRPAFCILRTRPKIPNP